MVEFNGYKVLNYQPFSSSQNIEGYYPIMVQTFLCQVKNPDDLPGTSDEAKNIRWVSLKELEKMLHQPEQFYPMHVSCLRQFCNKQKT